MKLSQFSSNFARYMSAILHSQGENNLLKKEFYHFNTCTEFATFRAYRAWRK